MLQQDLFNLTCVTKPEDIVYLLREWEDITQSLLAENEELRKRCKELEHILSGGDYLDV